MRTRTATASDLEQVGKFIDKGGNNFWGVEDFTSPAGGRLLAGSDRDFGLYLLRYTGRGRGPGRRDCDNANAVTFGAPVDIPMSCGEPNGQPATRSRSRSQAASGTATVSGKTIQYTPARDAATTRSP